MAYAGARFAFSLIKAIKGEKNIVECAYVESNVTSAKYFATPLVLGVSISAFFIPIEVYPSHFPIHLILFF